MLLEVPSAGSRFTNEVGYDLFCSRLIFYIVLVVKSVFSHVFSYDLIVNSPKVKS